MTSDLKVVVIGGGILGSSAAIHLLRAGVGDVTLLERDGVAQGTSAAGAGFVDPWSLGSTDATGAEEAALADYAIDFYRELNAVRPEAPYRRRGCLWMARTERDWPSVELRLSQGPADARLVEPAEIEELTGGVVRAAGIFRGVFHPSSAQVSAERATKALAGLFAAEGGTLRERTPVSGLVVEDGRVVAVDSAAGRIEADRVVLAAGAWTNTLLADLGRGLPIAPIAVSRIVTEPLGLPGDLPLLFVKALDSGLKKSIWLREEDGRLMFGANYETPSRLTFVEDGVPERFDGVDLDGVLEVKRAAGTLTATIPALAEYETFRVKHGAPCYTEDGRAVVGALPGVENLYVMAGDNEQGVTHGPGFGRVIAETIVAGGSDLVDAEVWSPGRFESEPRSPREVAAAL
jgi:sarcosine oxidase, subunit beta